LTRTGLFLVFVLILIGACDSTGREELDPTAHQWELTSGSLDGEPVVMVAGHSITLSFTDGDAGGTAACNGYGGPYTISGAELTFAPPTVTEMACSPIDVMDSEAAYLAALIRVSNYSMGEAGLSLTGDGVELVFVEIPPVPTAGLAGTLWVLDSLVRVDAISSVTGERATLELFSDGSVLGSTGCRSFTGHYQMSGPEVVFTDFAAEGECPAEWRNRTPRWCPCWATISVPSSRVRP
jgi:heat shock protein HslJ